MGGGGEGRRLGPREYSEQEQLAWNLWGSACGKLGHSLLRRESDRQMAVAPQSHVPSQLCAGTPPLVYHGVSVNAALPSLQQ